MSAPVAARQGLPLLSHRSVSALRGCDFFESGSVWGWVQGGGEMERRVLGIKFLGFSTDVFADSTNFGVIFR